MKAAPPDGFLHSDNDPSSLAPDNVRQGVQKGWDTRFVPFLAEAVNAPEGTLDSSVVYYCAEWNHKTRWLAVARSERRTDAVSA